MKTHALILPVLWIFATSMPVFGDTFVMKNGDRLVGRILSENDTSYVLEVQVSQGIKDEKTVKKTDVFRIITEQPDAVAFEKISSLVPVPDLLTDENYQERIAAAEKFLADFPQSPKRRAARKILDALKAEANEVLGGGIKINGAIVTAAERQANAYEVDARIAAARIQTMINQGQALQALRQFNQFSNDFRNTTAHAELVPVLIQVIQNHRAEAQRLLDSFDTRTKQRTNGLNLMSGVDRRRTEEAINEDTAAALSRYTIEKDSRVGWVTIDPYLKQTLDDTIAYAKQELTRLETLRSAPLIDGGKLYRDALSLIQKKVDDKGADADKNAARNHRAAVTSAISAVRNAKVPQRYLDILQKAAESIPASP